MQRPIIQTAAAVGSLVGQAVPLTDRERKILLGCGAAAGMTAIFATPLAAVLLALELLVFEFSAEAIVPIACAAAVALALRPSLLPPSPLFPSHAAVPRGGAPLAWVAGFGVIAGLEGAALTALLYRVEDWFARLKRHGDIVRPMVGGAVVGLIALRAPQVLGMGYDLIRSVLSGRMAATETATVLIAKGVGWVVALGSGTVGGVLAPLFLIAGCSGALLGDWLQPVTHLPPALAALVFMAAVFAAGSGAVLTAAVFAAEVSGNMGALPALLLASALAMAVAAAISPYNLMSGKLVRRGLRPNFAYFAPPHRDDTARAPGA